MIIYLIRHGQTTGDIEDRFGGDYDDHLTPKGKEQSEELAKKLGDKNIEIIFSSPKIRAAETVEIVRQVINCPVETKIDLRERNRYGVLTGLTKAEAKEKYPHLIELLPDTHNTIEGGEGYPEFQSRVTRAMNEIVATPHEIVAIVTHGGFIRTVFRDILKLGEIDLADCSFAVIRANDAEFVLEKLDGITLQSDSD